MVIILKSIQAIETDLKWQDIASGADMIHMIKENEMSEFEKELEKNMELNKVAYAKESPYSDYLVSKRDIERVFHDWQPPKPLVQVPRIVADYIETQKGNNYNGSAYLIVKHYDSFKDEGNDSELNIWIANNFNDFLSAIVNGYTVEKEKLYEVIINGHFLVKLMKDDDSKSHGFIEKDELVNWQETGYRLTAKQIKMIDDRYMAFAVKVDEVKP